MLGWTRAILPSSSRQRPLSARASRSAMGALRTLRSRRGQGALRLKAIRGTGLRVDVGLAPSPAGPVGTSPARRRASIE